MINYNLIKDVLIERIGLNQLPSDFGVQLTTDLTTSNSGLYFENSHPLLGAKVLYQFTPQHIINMDEGVMKNEAFSTWIKGLISAGTINTIQRWANEKNIERSAKNIIENQTLYEDGYADRFTENKGRFAAIKINTPNAQNTLLRVHNVGLRLVDPATVTLYLYKTGNGTPVGSVEVNHTGTGMETFNVEWDLKGRSQYYIGVDEIELEAQGVQLFISSIFYDSVFITSSTRHTHNCKFQPIYLSSRFEEYLPVYTSEYIGLNLDYSVLTDYTSFIVSNISKFYYPCMLGVAMKTLELYNYNPNTNVTRGTLTYSREQMQFDLFGDGDASLNVRYKKAIEAVKLKFDNLDPVTMSRSGRKIRLGNVG